MAARLEERQRVPDGRPGHAEIDTELPLGRQSRACDQAGAS
jgi:hypothetical protein